MWQFGGSEEHNVVSDGGGVVDSGERTGGKYRVVFDTPGDYPYTCTIHSGDMTGYIIRVVE